MSEPVNPLIVDLSHWEWPCDLTQVKEAGYVGVVWKASEGLGYVDPTYQDAREAARAAGLLWGAYHFGDSSDAEGQAVNFVQAAQPEPGDLFCLDWEPNSDTTMGRNQAQNWIVAVERALNREGQCVLYSGNQAKESLHGKDVFFGARRLWLAQYGSTPSWQESWTTYWLWQFTDGTNGPLPHQVDGVSGGCDLNSYPGPVDQLIAEWATGKTEPVPVPPGPSPNIVATVFLIASPGVHVVVKTLKPTTQEAGRGMRGKHQRTGH